MALNTTFAVLVRDPARARAVQFSPDRVFVPETWFILADNWVNSSCRNVQIPCLHTMGSLG